MTPTDRIHLAGRSTDDLIDLLDEAKAALKLALGCIRFKAPVREQLQAVLAQMEGREP